MSRRDLRRVKEKPILDTVSARDESTAVDWRRIDHTIVTLATAAAVAFFAILLAGWLVTSDDSLLAQSVAPLSVGGVGGLMLIFRRPQPLVQIVVGGMGLIVFVSVSESQVPGNPLIGVLVMSIMASVLAHRHVIVVSIVAAGVLAGTGWAWHLDGTPANDRAVAAFSLVASFVITAWVLQYLKRQSQETQQRLETLIASKDAFLATANHELRTPLTSVVGLAHELHDRWSDLTPEEISELTSLLAEESDDMSCIVDDLLVAGTADPGDLTMKRQVVDLHAVVAALLQHHPALAVPPPTRPLAVMADPVRVRQIVRNLVTNAQRYGGDNIRVVITGDGMTARVEVRDDGQALPADERRRIFDVYHRGGRVDGKPGSFGLGLTISRQLARLMGGDVEYTHQGGEAAFILSLPETSPRAAGLAALPAS